MVVAVDETALTSRGSTWANSWRNATGFYASRSLAPTLFVASPTHPPNGPTQGTQADPHDIRLLPHSGVLGER